MLGDVSFHLEPCWYCLASSSVIASMAGRERHVTSNAVADKDRDEP